MATLPTIEFGEYYGHAKLTAHLRQLAAAAPESSPLEQRTR